MQRIPVQVQSKVNTSINWEDEKFSYVVLTKGNLLTNKDDALYDRVMISPQKRGGHVIMRTCTGQDTARLTTRVVSKSDGRDLYKEARKSAWGDSFAFPDGTSEREISDRLKKKPFNYKSLAKVGNDADTKKPH